MIDRDLRYGNPADAGKEEASVTFGAVKPRILVVDDQPANVILLESILQGSAVGEVWATTDPREVEQLMRGFQPDLLLLDLQMPHLDGFEVLRQLPAFIRPGEFFPVLVLTADVTPTTRNRALGAGAHDFVSKPFDAIEVVLRCRNLLATRRLHLELAEYGRELETRVRERTSELEASRVELLEKLALAGDIRDDITGKHARRVGQLSAAIASRMGLNNRDIDLVREAAPLHDLGKIGISDEILHKPGRLTPEEFSEIKRHTAVGAELLSGSRFEVMNVAEDIARNHHERWDGKGYNGFAGNQISIYSQIVGVADVFDALANARPYKRAWPITDSVSEVKRLRGSHFSPEVVDAFLSLELGIETGLDNPALIGGNFSG